MQKAAYWLGNMIVDLLKLEVLVIASLGLFWAYHLIGNNSVLLYFLFPFALIPFTYVTSFVFKSDSTAQTVTMFVHFWIIAVSGTIVYIVRATPSRELAGDILNFVMKAVPSYPLTNGVYCDSHC
jgi:ATP-binding cassette, subfamily A (ABC1), member 3